jgi:phage anti-repressor protein
VCPRTLNDVVTDFKNDASENWFEEVHSKFHFVESLDSISQRVFPQKLDLHIVNPVVYDAIQHKSW